MGAMFRSEEMALCQLFLQPEAAYPSVSQLGEYGIVQFRDLNADISAFQRKFVNEVRRCDELDRKLRYIEGEIHKDGLKIPEEETLPTAPNPREIINLEASLEKTESEILELSQNAVNLKSNFLELTELKHVLEKTEVFFIEQEEANGETLKALAQDDTQQAITRGRLGFVAGVILRERVPAFERMLWRISRGNVFLRQAELDHPLEDPATGNEIYKTVFVAFFQGEQLKTRVKKVCTGFHASLYPCPSSVQERQEMLQGVKTRLEDLNLVLNQTKDHRARVLTNVAKQLQNWMIMVKKMKAIYHIMNMFNMDVTKKCLIAECWVPVGDLPKLRLALQEGGKECGSTLPSFLNLIDTTEEPPTFNRTNKFTSGFQNLIDAYGVSCYREVNPALYTIIWFPFLFGTMFGDMGHGLIMFCFALFMVLQEEKYMKKKSKSEIWNIFFAGRYIILLMGIFSVYTGLIYNDIFSKSVNIFGSSWKINFSLKDVTENIQLTLNPNGTDYKGYPYPVGMDPIWQEAENKIIFQNSFKMKLSIIFGVVHMFFGVCLSVANHVHFRQRINIILEFIPQILFLVLLFGYMVVLMFMKWVMYASGAPTKLSEACAPSVLIMFINMMLLSPSERVAPPCDDYMFEGQELLHKVLVLVALLCIPFMLLGKPIYILCTRRNKTHKVHSNGDINQGMELQPEEIEAQPTRAQPHHEEHEEEMMEIFIHQAIHTVEYVLSTVSHTASYLRLWALSLAHAQLSEVLWSMIFRMALTFNGYVGVAAIFIIFAIWAVFTIGILVMMEGLSAFLHTLRLHWVEFMSKFFTGTGYIFEPFAFKKILEEEVEED